MEDKQRIEEACAAQGLTIQGWDEDEDGVKALLGRWEVSNDDPDGMFFVEEEGELSASVVGASKYHNQRVMFGFTADGTDSASEVSDPLSYLDPAF